MTLSSAGAPPRGWSIARRSHPRRVVAGVELFCFRAAADAEPRVRVNLGRDLQDISPGGARLRSFPTVIRERIPALDAFRYFVAENQIAVVDPASAQVVAVMEDNR